ncbi:MAG: hypothetical protein QXO86_05815 [Nitrososphaerota archaeon]
MGVSALLSVCRNAALQRGLPTFSMAPEEWLQALVRGGCWWGSDVLRGEGGGVLEWLDSRGGLDLYLRPRLRFSMFRDRVIRDYVLVAQKPLFDLLGEEYMPMVVATPPEHQAYANRYVAQLWNSLEFFAIENTLWYAMRGLIFEACGGRCPDVLFKTTGAKKYTAVDYIARGPWTECEEKEKQVWHETQEIERVVLLFSCRNAPEGYEAKTIEVSR